MKVFTHILTYLAVIGLAGWMGASFGASREREAQDKEAEYRAALEARTRVIAVASLDEGVTTDSGYQNYASNIINTLGDEFVLTSYSLARAGLTDGMYDGILIFPADFSKKVNSVNLIHPQKITIDYQVNDKLPEAAYIETVKTIEKFQNELSGTVSYMYVTSAFKDLHEAQDHGNKLIQNNEKTLSAIEEVKSFHFTRNLKLDDMPYIKLDIQTVNTQPYTDSMAQYILDISAVYENAYNTAMGNATAHWQQALADINDIIDDLEDLRQDVYTELSGPASTGSVRNAIDDIFQDLIDELTLIRDDLLTYSPQTFASFVLDADVRSKQGQYQSDLSRLSGEFNTAQSKHIETVNTAYSEYSKYIAGMRQSVFEAYMDELDQIEKAKNLFVEVGKETHEETRTLIWDFTSKLPNSRSGQGVNQDVAEFISSPVALTHAEVRAVPKTETESSELSYYILYACIAVLAFSIVVRIIRSMNQKSRKEANNGY